MAHTSPWKPFVFLLTVAFAGAITVPAAAQNSESLRSGGLVNGRWWRAQSELGRAAYLNGFREAVTMMTRAGAPAINDDELAARASAYIPGGTPTEIREALDRFYEVPENRAIPVSPALQIMVLKFSGADQNEIDRKTLEIRRIVAGLAPKN